MNGPRYGNSDESMDDDFAKAMILGMQGALQLANANSNTFLEQTICYKQSRFLNDAETEMDEKSIRLWTVRLIYLAIHYHQHKHAIPEALARYGERKSQNEKENDSGCSSELEAKGIGIFDYECPNAKHLVISMNANGLGNNLRGTNVPGIVAALSSGRVVHILNNVEFGEHKQTRRLGKPWEWSSCDRRDFQCVFMPPSPCALSHDDFLNAYHLEKIEARQLAAHGKLPKGHEDEKVWISSHGTLPIKSIPKPATLQLNETIRELIDLLPETDPRLAVMRKAADSLHEKEEQRSRWHYIMATGRIEHAAVIYSARLNLRYTPKLDAIIDKIVPQDYDAENSVGLPVRGAYQLHAPRVRRVFCYFWFFKFF